MTADEMMQWNDNMDEAPRDGREVKLLTHEGEYVGYFKQWWYPYEIEGFTVTGIVSVNPTHWMPLPEPPK